MNQKNGGKTTLRLVASNETLPDTPQTQPVADSDVTTVTTEKQQVVTESEHHRKGGGNGSGNGGGNDGFFSDPKWKQPSVLVVAIATILGVLSLFVISIRTDWSKREESNMEYSKQKIAEANAQAAASGVLAPGYTVINKVVQPVVVSQSDNADQVNINNVPVYAHTVSCSSYSEDVEEIQSLGRGKSMHISSGCMTLRVEGRVKIDGLDGSDYLLAVPDSAISGNYFKCGTYAGFNNTVKECKDFLDYHAGRKVSVGVKSGTLIIN